MGVKLHRDCIKMAHKVAGRVHELSGHPCEIGIKHGNWPHHNELARPNDWVGSGNPYHTGTIIADIHVETEEDDRDLIEIFVVTGRPGGDKSVKLSLSKFDLRSELTVDYFADIIVREWLGIRPPKKPAELFHDMINEKVTQAIEQQLFDQLWEGRDGTRP